MKSGLTYQAITVHIIFVLKCSALREMRNRNVAQKPVVVSDAQAGSDNEDEGDSSSNEECNEGKLG